MNDQIIFNHIAPEYALLGSKRGRIYHKPKPIAYTVKPAPVSIKKTVLTAPKQNVSETESIIRVLCIPGLIVAAVIGLNLTTAHVYKLITAEVYLTITGLAFYCPLKTLWKYAARRARLLKFALKR